MAPKTKPTSPTTSALSDSTRLDSTDVSVRKVFSRLSQPSLLELVCTWLKSDVSKVCMPRLDSENGEENLGYSSASSLEELRELYEELKERKGDKEHVLNRILDGDWRYGISLQQLAMADTQYLLDQPSSQRWTALKLINTIEETKRTQSSTNLIPPPKFHMSSFLQNLQRDIGSMVKSHYYVSRIASLRITLLRIQIFDTPFSSLRANNAKKGPVAPNSTMYIAFPDNLSLIYTSAAASASNAKASEGNAMRKLVLDALPRAFSRHGERYRLEMTSQKAESLSALSVACGKEYNTTANGGWSIYVTGTFESSLLRFSGTETHRKDLVTNKNLSEDPSVCSQTGRVGNRRKRIPYTNGNLPPKRRRLVAQARFGESAFETDGKGIEVLDVHIQDPFPFNPAYPNGPSAPIEQGHSPMRNSPMRGSPSGHLPKDGVQNNLSGIEAEDNSSRWAPGVQLRFHGSHIFAGIRKLVETGAIDGEKMPGWMTGEDGVGDGTVKKGNLIGA